MQELLAAADRERGIPGEDKYDREQQGEGGTDRSGVMHKKLATIMAAVVLLNLVQIQISQRKRELTIMRVNGFTLRETVNYILRENILTTVLGLLLGLFVGNLAARYNLDSIERVELMMYRDVNITACLIAVLITTGFAIIVNLLALRKIHHLNLTDIQG